MIGTIRYSAANAAVHEGIGRLLPEQVWMRLLAAKSLEEILSILSGTAYRESVLEGPENLDEVERRIRASLAGRLRAAMPFVSGHVRELLDWLWRPLELDNLIIILRALHSRVGAARIRSSLVPLGSASELDWQQLPNAKSVADLVDRMQDSYHGELYGRALDQARQEYERQRTVFVLEVALYRLYYRKLSDIIERLWGRDRKEAKRFVGAIIDSRNLLWVYRYRVFFRFGPETILSYTLPCGEWVDASLIQRAASGAPPAELVKTIWRDGLPDLNFIQNQSQRQTIVELETFFRRYFYDLAHKTLQSYPHFHLGTILAYLILLESEVDDLVSIIEGKANDWSGERIRSCLIRWWGG